MTLLSMKIIAIIIRISIKLIAKNMRIEININLIYLVDDTATNCINKSVTACAICIMSGNLNAWIDTK